MPSGASGASSSASASGSASLVASDGQPATRKGRKVVRDDTSNQVSKFLFANFKDFNDVQKHVLHFSGLSLQETLEQDFRANKMGKGPNMGPEYVKTLRKRFALHSSPSAQLPPTNPSEEIRPALREAYKAFKGKPVNRNPLLEFLKTHKYHNCKEVVGLARAILEQVPSKCVDQRSFVLSGMTWFRENNLHENDC